MEIGALPARSLTVGAKVAAVFHKRAHLAQDRLYQRVSSMYQRECAGSRDGPAMQLDLLGGYRYAIDAMQRAVLFWDTLRRRGDDFIDRARTGFTPVLHFGYETVLDGRRLDRPVNYALLRIVPPAGVTVDPKRRPYLIIDPRAGHGPGIGGFKDDSQVGVALRAGHPVYFVVFFRDPEPGQTLIDVCDAEHAFLQKVRGLHPDSPKPAVVGNCQGGWAAMMLAASNPDDTGPIVVNGAPMSYWSGAWSEGAGDNPMRYAAGMLGGTWLVSMAADLGNGKFDGAHLVQNFENLNPANSLWDKYYHLFDLADTEPPRFLDFERWWGGYYLMNRQEIEWIVRNLFVGNKLWSGSVKAGSGESFDLRNIRSPIVLFASMGDNITPPQQAFNWIADTYGSTEEVKYRGQVIVGLKHDTIGHLGIFVSGKVAAKEHTQIVSVLRHIEQLPPGLYGMSITERKTEGAGIEYDVSFEEHRLEDVVAKLNRFQRLDEQPFEAVAVVSEVQQRAYELFGRPVVEALSNELTAQWLRAFHPLRVQNWSVSGLNAWLSWLAPAAQQVRGHRQAVASDHPLRRCERFAAECVSASLDSYRALRDAAIEASFFTLYANLVLLLQGEKDAAPGADQPATVDPRKLPMVKQALAAMAEGGYAAALGRVAVLLTDRNDEPLPLSRLEMRRDLMETYAAYLPDLPMHRWRSLRGEQEIIVRLEPNCALGTLPALLAEPEDRIKLLTLLDLLATDRRVLGASPTDQQLDMLARIRAVLDEAKLPRRRPAPRPASQPATAAPQGNT